LPGNGILGGVRLGTGTSEADDPWADDFIKGIQGLLNYFRSNTGSDTSSGRDDDYCYNRWESEDALCKERAPKWQPGCRERAADRRRLCIQYKGRPPREPNEWSEADEETSFFPEIDDT